MKHSVAFFLTSVIAAAWAAPALGITSAELIRNQAYVYGRFEARVRFAPGDGVVSSFFLWKSGSEVSGTFWNELDFEKLGADCHLQTNALYGSPLTDTSQSHVLDADLCSDYHTYAFEWTPEAIVWLVDGTEVRRATAEVATAFAENAKAGMQIHFNVWPGDESFGGVIDPAILPVRQYVNWVQYSSYADGKFTQQWREEFDANKLPSGWSKGNWESPKGKSTHGAANVTFSSSISTLSLTEDNATGFADTPPSDGSAGGTPSTGGASGAGGAGTTAGGASAVGAATGGASSTSTSTSIAPFANPPDDSGSGCSMLRPRRAKTGAVGLILGLGLLAVRRRRTPAKSGT